MANEDIDRQGTDLIDVGEIPTEFDDEFTRDRGPDQQRAAGPEVVEGPVIAEISDRAAAFFIDCCFLYVIYWLILLPYRAIALGSAEGPVPASGLHGILFHSIFLIIAFLWFALFEFAAGASPGKMLCRLTVRKADGSPVGIGAAALRNLMRPVDLILAPLLVTLAAMEWSPWHKRLGDLAAGTLVIRTLSRRPRQFAVSLDIVSSAIRRALAFAIDILLLSALLFVYALIMTPTQPLLSMLMVVYAPVVILAYFLIPEWLAHTSCGKWIMGLSVCSEDGTAATLSSAAIRTVWRLYDANPAGLLTCLMSIRKQRPGDSAAGTLVVKSSRDWNGLIALGAAIACIALLAYAGQGNRDSFLRGDFEVNFLPSIDVRGASVDKRPAAQMHLSMLDFNFAADRADNIRRPAIYQPGETVYMIFDVAGYTLEAGGAWIQQDLSIMYPDGTVGLKLENIHDFKQKITKPGPVRLENNLALPEQSQPGRYTVTITLRDRHARREVKEQRFFYITPPEGAQPAVPAVPTRLPGATSQ